MSGAQKPLDFRRSCFSHDLSLLISAFSLLIAPPKFPLKLRHFTERSATISSLSNDICQFGGSLEPRYIFGAKKLDQCASTRSSKDGCFQAHLLDVIVFSLPLPLRERFRTLLYILGCFPLDYEP